MSYQKTINFFKNHLNVEQNIGLKEMFNQEERIISILKLNLKRQL